jgi:lipopolysaccharide/colanic/teichoic acid biosynthesis glycosyltransferase
MAQPEPRSEPLLKRPFDVMLASVALLLSLPVWLAIALAIKLEDGGPILHGEERWGWGRTVFRIHKFRTTVVNPESTAPVEADLGHRRFTRVGKLLRARGIDELPQLLNILKGEMSFVGPRPLAVEEVTAERKKEYATDPRMAGFQERLSVRPGLTGIAQIFGSRYLSHRNKFRYDLLYVRNQGFLLDLRLLALSLWVSVRGKWEAKGKKL